MSDIQGFPPPPPLPGSTPQDRVPPPWETQGPAVQRSIDTIRAVLTSPGVFFRTMARVGGLGAPLLYALIGVLIGSVGSALTRSMMPFGGFRGAGLGARILLVPVILFISLFISSGILHLLLLLVAQTRQSFETTFRVVSYTAGSAWPLLIVPFLGGLASAIASLILLIVGSADAHEVSQGKAAVAVLLPSVICCGVAFLFGSAVLALMFGAAAAGLRP